MRAISPLRESSRRRFAIGAIAGAPNTWTRSMAELELRGHSYPSAGVLFCGYFRPSSAALAAAKGGARSSPGARSAAARVAQRADRQDDWRIAPALSGTRSNSALHIGLYVRANEFKFSGSFIALLRDRGIHIWKGPLLSRTAHTAADAGKIAPRPGEPRGTASERFSRKQRKARSRRQRRRHPGHRSTARVAGATLGTKHPPRSTNRPRSLCEGLCTLDALRRAATEILPGTRRFARFRPHGRRSG